MFILKATDRENRGSTEVQYGFVYFNDGRRVVYTSTTGVSGGTGGWLPVTPTHIRLAKEFLLADGVVFANK